MGFKNGQAQKSFVGLKDEDEIQSFVNELVGKWHLKKKYIVIKCKL